MKATLVRTSLLALIAAAFLPTPTFAQPFLTAADAAQMKAETPQLSDVAMSPDGKWVTYAVTRRSTAANERKMEHLLQRVPRAGEEAAEPVRLPEGATGVQWRPDSKCLSMILGGKEYEPGRVDAEETANFACYDIATGAVMPIPARGASVTGNYKWSPRGNHIAFAAPLAERAPLDQRRGAAHGLIEPGQFMALFILDVRAGAAAQLTPDAMNVARSPAGNFDWSPDERSLAVAVDREVNSWGYNTDLVVIDRASRRVRPLVTRPGMNGSPCWSPDGRWIAFATHQEDLAYRVGWPAMVPASGGKAIDFPQSTTPMGFTSCNWSADNRAFHYVSSQGMTLRLARADAASRRAVVLPQASDLHLAFENNRSFSADGMMMAFTRESLTKPPELFVVALDMQRKPAGTPIQLTNLAPDFVLGNFVHTEELSWPSPDGKFTIHGLLLTPASTQGKLPTLLYFIGGPAMVRRGFGEDGWNGAYLPLAARGYAVLIPNTRGRGGYGVEFWNAIRTGKNRGRDPLADALAGLDLLIARGIADRDRTGVLGHSYGAYMTAYTITQTNRFKAAVIHDGSFFLTWGGFFGGPSGEVPNLIGRDLFGIHNPFDAAERTRLIEESPGLHADRVRTPTMLLSAGEKGTPFGPYGAHFPNPVMNSIPFYNGLRRFSVPAALLVYDEGHVFQRPAAIADNLTRTAEWLDYWVRGMPFPDPERAKEYGQKKPP